MHAKRRQGFFPRESPYRFDGAPGPTAVRACIELERCFLTKWSGYDWVVWRLKQNAFHHGGEPIATADQSKMDGRSECRTVNEAMMVILYPEPGWKTSYQGDWRK